MGLTHSCYNDWMIELTGAGLTLIPLWSSDCFNYVIQSINLIPFDLKRAMNIVYALIMSKHQVIIRLPCCL